MAKRNIKIFSHNDLDGFGAPVLVKTVQDVMFPDAEFDLTSIGAGRIDSELDYWFKSPEAATATDVWIMDMTPDSEHTMQELNQQFANHWLVFDHHETEAALRQKFAANTVKPADAKISPSATSLVWDWLKTLPGFVKLNQERQQQLAELVELIRAYDTWDWQNDPDMSEKERQAADDFNQLFWFYPLDHSEAFVQSVFDKGWTAYRQDNDLLIQTLNERRAKYLKSHLKDVVEVTADGHRFGIVYASDYKSEIAHELLVQQPDLDAALVISPKSVSLRSNGKVDVAKFAETYYQGGGHADAAGGRLDINPIRLGEQAVADELEQMTSVKKEEKAETESTLADNLDPDMAAKLAALFGKKED